MNIFDDIKKCIGCGICTNSCEFLKKYNLTLGDIDKLGELAYSCFMCGECTLRCPSNIDGAELILKLREVQVKENNNRIKVKGYSSLLIEKQDYLFKNYKRGKEKSVLFPGCNFPSLYPKTTNALISLFQYHDIGVVFDCCGKPISYLGLKDKTDEIIYGINERLNKLQVEEVIVLCPNCYYFLKDRLSSKVVNIYDKFTELGIMPSKNVSDMDIFIPCPDKKHRIILESIKNYLKDTKINEISSIQCCGLGGCATANEPFISKGFTKKLIDDGYNEIYSYCASCAGNFSSNGIEKSHHILSVILNIDEDPDLKNSLINRIKTKFL